MESGVERIFLAGASEFSGASTAHDWWGKYAKSLKSSGLSERACAVIEADSRYILERGVHGCGPTDVEHWPAFRQRSGMVMGAVQSGKTASMLGVAALAMDAGVDVVVLLAGTRVALWRQTYERLVRQLSPSDDGLLMPSPAIALGDGSGNSLGSWYQLRTPRVRRALQDRRPLILVVMKHSQHLAAASKFLHERVYEQASQLKRPVEVLVLDDEADDGSILDAVVENALDPSLDAFKQIPRHIVDLWSTRQVAPETAAPNLYATYVAYTATPQANFLQADQNPLAPRDFAVALRTPGAVGELDPRSSSFLEPLGPNRYYTGGSIFYPEGVAESPFIVTEPAALDEADPLQTLSQRRRWIAEAVRAYLVAAAVRSLRDPSGRLLSNAVGKQFATAEEVKAACPPPHTMLFHPSAAVSDQFDAAAELLAWARGIAIEDAQIEVAEGRRYLDADVLERDMTSHPEAWTKWLSTYSDSAAYLQEKYVLDRPAKVPEPDSWQLVREQLLTEIIPFVRMSVINSNSQADDRPQFEPVLDSGTATVPPDVFTIFVSGNVMARGLTLEGLTTTLFLRTTQDPAADTQMQMQRWFGYRGGFLDVCRVFLPDEQRQLFSAYHDTDEALRRQLLDAMNNGGSAPKPLVLEGLDFRATGKIANISKIPLAPGATPIIDIVNSGTDHDPNLDLVIKTFAAGSSEVIAKGTVRGRILPEPLDLRQAAELLDGLRYSEFAPDLSSPTSTRWDAIAAQVGLAADAVPEQTQLFRPPPNGFGDTMRAIPASHCPYNIAAYLRLWHSLLSRRAAGFFPTDDGTRRWSSLDLLQKQATQPKFYVGLRFGSAAVVGTDLEPALSTLDFDVHPMVRRIENSVLKSTWGSRNPGEGIDTYLGDQLFDYHFHGFEHRPDPEGSGPMWRPVGAPGLILFHVVSVEGWKHPVVAVGLGIPLGGPDHFASRA